MYDNDIYSTMIDDSIVLVYVYVAILYVVVVVSSS